jgi:hypothetical protein
MKIDVPHLVEHYAKIRQYRSGIVLVLMNLIPLVGVLFFGWSGFNIVFLYWSENVVIGFFNVLKMLTVGIMGDPRPVRQGGPDLATLPGRLVALAVTLFSAAFFAFHYGFFTYIHGIFVVALCKVFPGLLAGQGPTGELFDLWLYVKEAFAAGLWLAFVALFFSHGFSFVMNFLYRGEYQKVSVLDLMIAPYGRIIVLHLAIIFGAFLGLLVGFPTGLVALLVVIKIGVDLALHLKERQTGAIWPMLGGVRSPRLH